MNGQDFIDGPEIVEIYNAPQLVRLRSSWLTLERGQDLEIEGNNFFETGQIQVSFRIVDRTESSYVRGTYARGKISCAIPEFLRHDASLSSGQKVSIDVQLRSDLQVCTLSTIFES